MAILGRALPAGSRRGCKGAGATAALLAAGCLALLAGAGSLVVLARPWVTSLAMSAVFPTTLAIAGDRYHRYAGSVFGFLFTIANFGGMLFPWALGRVSQAAGVRLGMIVPLVGTLAVAGLALAVKRTDGRLSLGN
jgi:fucose permease